MNLESFLKKLKETPESIQFSDTMEIVDALYDFTPTEFKNGNTTNLENQNNGSCKLFAFAQLQGLSKDDTLSCFGQFYTQDVLQNPKGDDHQNIRNFMTYAWAGIQFQATALTQK